jgi:hypothetical protein
MYVKDWERLKKEIKNYKEVLKKKVVLEGE